MCPPQQQYQQDVLTHRRQMPRTRYGTHLRRSHHRLPHLRWEMRNDPTLCRILHKWHAGTATALHGVVPSSRSFPVPGAITALFFSSRSMVFQWPYRMASARGVYPTLLTRLRSARTAAWPSGLLLSAPGYPSVKNRSKIQNSPRADDADNTATTTELPDRHKNKRTQRTTQATTTAPTGSHSQHRHSHTMQGNSSGRASSTTPT